MKHKNEDNERDPARDDISLNMSLYIFEKRVTPPPTLGV
jgi:hypothetical protein